VRLIGDVSVLSAGPCSTQSPAPRRHEPILSPDFLMIIKNLLRLHRWVSLILAPLFLVILVSGALLAFEPILGIGAAQPAAAVDAAALARILERLDAGTARAVMVEPDGATAELRFGHRMPPARIDIASGTVLAEGEGESVFGMLHELHEGLLIGAKPVVEWSAWAMVVLVLGGPFLAWPRLRNTLSGWHAGFGWILFPLVLLPAGTEALRTLDFGRPQLIEPAPSSPKVSWASAIAQAGAVAGLSHLKSARRLPGGGIAVTTGQGADTRAWIVTSQGVTAGPIGRKWMKDLHDGIWAAPWSGWVSLVSAGALLGLLGTGTLAWTRRQIAARRQSADAGADVLIAHASQTGTAARYAEATAEALRLGGSLVATASLAALLPVDLQRYRAVLLVVSTTGEGQVPEPARGFVQALQDSALENVRFALLALGDRRYPRFCAGGEAVRAALVNAGALEILPMTRADREPAEAWQDWMRAVTAELGLRSVAVARPEADLPVTLTLLERTRLDNPDQGETNEVWSLTLRSETALNYRAGDLLLVSPGEGEPERCYSIAGAAVADGRTIRLTVSLSAWIAEDGEPRFGAASGLLCRTWQPGDRIAGWLRRHPTFNAPTDPNRPIIMVASGCGIAPFIGFLAEREAAGSRGASWLVFGNRRRSADFLHGERLQAWARDGVLARLDTAFSRDPGDGAHVQHRLIEQAPTVWDWLTDRNAILYACGRLSTLGRDLDEVLVTIIRSQGGLPAEDAEALLAQWRAEGRIRRDVFD
jgi:sulfite reductase (NADPH) flavoprotein alpha-component